MPLREDGSSVKAEVPILPPEQWRVIGQGSAPAFQNSWVNYDTTYAPARFIKTASGVVYIEGLVKSGTISTTLPVFTLPAGYRPGYRQLRVTISNSALGRIDITTDGLVIPYTGNNAWFALWCSFYVG